MFRPAASNLQGRPPDPVAEEIAPRILYSADSSAIVAPVGLAEDVVGARHQLEIFDQDALQEPQAQTREATLVVLDARLPDLGGLTRELEQARQTDDALTVLIVNSDEDGVAKVADFLGQSERPFSSVHILSHGQQGQFQLGDTLVDGNSLRSSAGTWARWSSGLSAQADLNIYGCDLTSTQDGRELVDSLASLTGADVAASSDTTGHADLGGDWELEYQHGEVSATAPLSAAFRSQWAATLDIGLTGSEQVVNQTLPGRQEFRDEHGGRHIASNGTDMVIVWENTDDSTIYFRRYDADGTPRTDGVAGETAIENTLAVDRRNPTVAIAADGDFIIAWESDGQDGDGRGIYAMRFNADGTPKARPGDAFGGSYSNAFEFRANNMTTGFQGRPAVGMRDDGSFAVVWVSTNSTGGFTSLELRHRTYNADGTRIGGTNEGYVFADGLDLDQLHPAVAAGPVASPYLVSFNAETAAGDQDIRIRTIATSGATSGNTVIGSAGEIYGNAQIAMNADGDYAVAYETSINGGDIEVRRFTSAGADMDGGAAISVTDTTTGDQLFPRLSMNDSGRILVAWQDQEPVGIETDVAIREISAAGVALGSETIVNTTTASHQRHADVVFIGTDAAVLWEGHSDTGHEVYLRMIESFVPVGPVTDSDGAANEISENAVANDLTGLVAQAIDSDPTDSVDYSLVSNPGNLFQINLLSGSVSLNGGASLDREMQASHTIRVRADSTDGSSSEQDFVIAVLDVNDTAPVVTNSPMNVSENASLGTSVGFASSTDADTTGAPQNWQITGGTGASAFAINAATGEITVADPSQLNHEVSPDLVVNLTVSDGVNTSNQQPITISIDDQPEPPVGGNSGITTPEDTDVALAVSDFSFSDPDDLDQLGEIVIESLPGSGSLVFNGSVLGAPGQVVDSAQMTAGLLIYRPAPDQSGAPITSFDVTVRDSTGLPAASRSQISVTVTPVNDAPQITSNGGGASAGVSISENSTAITTVTATDIDSGPSAFSIAGGDDASRFSIDAGGMLSMAAMPDFESPADVNTDNQYVVIVQARDAGGKVDTQQITVSVTDQPEAPSGGASSVLALEDTGYSFSLGDFAFSDQDAGDQLDAIVIDALPMLGEIRLNGTVLTNPGQVVDRAQIQAGALVFEPPAGQFGSSLTQFDVVVRDASGLSAALASTVSVSVNPVNDAPTFSGSLNQSVTVGVETGIAGSTINIADVDNDLADLAISIQQAPSLGQLLFDGVPMTATDTFTAADLAQNRISFLTPSVSPTGSDQFRLRITDPSGDGVSVTVVIHIQTNFIATPQPDNGAASGPSFGEDNLSSGADQSQSASSKEEGEQSDSYFHLPGNGNGAANSAGGGPLQANAGLAASGQESTAASPPDGHVDLGRRLMLMDGDSNYEQYRVADLPARPDHERRTDIAFESRRVAAPEFLFGDDMQRTASAIREQIDQSVSLDQRFVATSAAASTALSVGYVLWLIRGGALLSSVLASMPAWRSIDPLPILGSMSGSGNAGPDDESLEELLQKSDEPAAQPASAQDSDAHS